MILQSDGDTPKLHMKQKGRSKCFDYLTDIDEDSTQGTTSVDVCQIPLRQCSINPFYFVRKLTNMKKRASE